MLTAPDDASAADWVIAGVRDFDYTVGSIVPTVFEACARVFHPAQRRERDSVLDVRCAEVASANGTVIHPAAEWGSLTGSWQLKAQPGLWDTWPRAGELPARVAAVLAAILAVHTDGADRWWFAPSALRGEPSLMLLTAEGTPAGERERLRQAQEARLAERQRRLDSAPRFKLPDREFRLFRGPLGALDELYAQLDVSPNLWWPDDRAWCVGTGIDLMTTYVGASRACVAALLGDEQLEVLAVSDDQSVTWEADTINPLPARP